LEEALIKRLVLILLCILGFVSIQGDVHGQDLEPDRATSLVWSPADDRVAVGYEDGTLRIWDAATQQILTTIEGVPGPIYDLDWNPNGTRLVSLGTELAIRIWNPTTGENILTLDGLGDYGCVGWSPNGTQLAVVFGEGLPNIFIWDINTGELVFSGITGTAGSVQWNPDGRRITFSLISGQIDVWRTSPYERIGYLGEELSTVEGEASTHAWSPNEDYLAAGTLGGTIIVWDVSSGEQLFELAGIDYPFQSDNIYPSAIEAVSFSPDGQTLQSISGYGTIRQWDITTGELLNTLDLDQPTPAAAFSPNGTQIAYASDTNSVEVIEVFPAATETKIPDDIRDNDKKFTQAFDTVFRSDGLHIISASPIVPPMPTRLRNAGCARSERSA
jgi:WD40 repeat protein